MRLKADTDVSKVIQELADYGGKVQDGVVDLLNGSVKIIETKAKQNVKQNGDNIGRLASSIDAELVSDPNHPFARVVVRARYGPYVEFGTKSRARIPSGLAGYAEQFKGGGGSFDDLLKNIKQWCKKKGIDKEAAFPIAVNIARNGVSPQPFLFPAYFAEIPKIEKGLAKLLKRVK